MSKARTTFLLLCSTVLIGGAQVAYANISPGGGDEGCTALFKKGATPDGAVCDGKCCTNRPLNYCC
jgi:hypothetical protein